jgi:hypothetical protein
MKRKIYPQQIADNHYMKRKMYPQQIIKHRVYPPPIIPQVIYKRIPIDIEPNNCNLENKCNDLEIENKELKQRIIFLENNYPKLEIENKKLKDRIITFDNNCKFVYENNTNKISEIIETITIKDFNSDQENKNIEEMINKLKKKK